VHEGGELDEASRKESNVNTRRGIGFLAVLMVVAAASATTGAAQTPWFAAQLAGDREVGNPGDVDGWGVGVVGLEADSVRYYLWVTDVAQPTAAHIHTGPVGQNGGVHIDFAPAFTEVASNTWVAVGSVAADPDAVAAVLDNPAGFYFNVHNADHPTGAVRGQVLGDGPSGHALAGTLRGFRQIDNPGDPDGEGFGTVVFDDHTAFYYLAVDNIADPVAAHIHGGTAVQNGTIAVDFEAQFADGVSSGSVDVDEDVEAAILAHPENYYFNVHNPEYQTGAVRGQLRATETLLILPVASRIAGQAGSAWRTDLRVLNQADEAGSVWAEWYPSGSAGLGMPAATVELGVGAASTAVVNDSVATLFGADGNGAMRLLAAEPVAAASRIFNDQRGNPDIGGTFGQFAPATDPGDLAASGALLLGSNRPASAGEGWRSNVGYFNPGPTEVEATFSVWSAGGELLGTDAVTIAGFSNEVKGVFQLVPSVPQSDRTLDDLVVTFAASRPIAVYLSVVDNVTNDPVFISPSAVSAAFASGAVMPANRPPVGTIVQPSGDVTIDAGGSVSFEGEATDPDGDDMTYLWDFGDDITSTELSPGMHTYTEAGTYTVTFTATDSNGLSDPSPDTRTVVVEAGGNAATSTRVQSEIFSASCAFAGCHGASAPAQGLNLSEGAAYGDIVNVASSERPSLDRIEPNDPMASYLFLKVIGDSTIVGGRMPLGSPPLADDLIGLLQSWIERGAPND
jgi:hypothetical protein